MAGNALAYCVDPLAIPDDAGVVDENVEAARRLEPLGCGGDRAVVGDVDLHEVRAHRVRRLLAARLVARADPHLVALGLQSLCGLVAEALVRSGYQCPCHAFMVEAESRSDKRTVLPRTRRATVALRSCAILGGVSAIDTELGACIRSWRDRVLPAEAGLPSGSARPGPGPRRGGGAPL